MTLALSITAKDEAAVIGRCIASARPFVTRAVLVDTGSTDDTIEVARRTCERLRLPLEVHHREWHDFATNYTIALDLARPLAGYVWLLDADEVASAPVGWTFPADRPDAFECCRIWAGDWEVWGTRIFRSDRPWRYVGARHARPVLEGASVARIEGLEVDNRRDGHSGNAEHAAQRERFLRDVDTFTEQLRHNPSDTRAAYYLAQSYHDAGMVEEALAAYHHRAEMPGGFDEERYLSLLQVARYKRRLRHSPDSVTQAYRAAHAARPSRHEALVELARWHNDRAEYFEAWSAANLATTLPPSRDRFLVQRSAATWRPWVELARSLDGLGSPAEASHAWRRVTDFDALPAAERARAQHRLTRAAA